MPDTNDLPTDSAVSQLTVDLCRELYDRFVMGGWVPQDAHSQTEAMIQQHFIPPAADAGPRQPVPFPEVTQEVAEQLRHYIGNPLYAIETAISATDSDSAIEETSPAIERMKRVLHDLGKAAPSVPQEAAPRLCTNCKEESWTHCRFHDPAHCHVECAQGTVPPWPTEQYPPRCKRVEPATAPDWAMRVARKIWEYGYVGKAPEPNAADLEEIAHSAALIRQAGSRESRKPDGWAHQYHNCIRFNQGQMVNGEQPFHAVPYWLETNGEAGSERERELTTVIANLIAAAHPAIQSGRNGWVQSTPNVKKLETACAEASRLLGGESK